MSFVLIEFRVLISTVLTPARFIKMSLARNVILLAASTIFYDEWD
jgi:hypothetical protein